MKTLIFYIVLICFIGCNIAENKSPMPNTSDQTNLVVFERSSLESDSVRNLSYYSGINNLTNGHFIYEFDSILFLKDSIIRNIQDPNFYAHSNSFYISNDTLWIIEQDADKKTNLKLSYLYRSERQFQIIGMEYDLFKFQVADTTLYGNETVFFSPQIGFVESYNNLTRHRVSVVKSAYLSDSRISRLIKQLRSDHSFYR